MIHCIAFTCLVFASQLHHIPNQNRNQMTLRPVLLAIGSAVAAHATNPFNRRAKSDRSATASSLESFDESFDETEEAPPQKRIDIKQCCLLCCTCGLSLVWSDLQNIALQLLNVNSRLINDCIGRPKYCEKDLERNVATVGFESFLGLLYWRFWPRQELYQDGLDHTPQPPPEPDNALVIDEDYVKFYDPSNPLQEPVFQDDLVPALLDETKPYRTMRDPVLTKAGYVHSLARLQQWCGKFGDSTSEPCPDPLSGETITEVREEEIQRPNLPPIRRPVNFTVKEMPYLPLRQILNDAGAEDSRTLSELVRDHVDTSWKVTDVTRQTGWVSKLRQADVVDPTEEHTPWQIERWKPPQKDEAFDCSILSDVSGDPVLVSSGHIFDRSRIVHWCWHSHFRAAVEESPGVWRPEDTCKCPNSREDISSWDPSVEDHEVLFLPLRSLLNRANAFSETQLNFNLQRLVDEMIWSAIEGRNVSSALGSSDQFTHLIQRVEGLNFVRRDSTQWATEPNPLLGRQMKRMLELMPDEAPSRTVREWIGLLGKVLKPQERKQAEQERFGFDVYRPNSLMRKPEEVAKRMRLLFREASGGDDVFNAPYLDADDVKERESRPLMKEPVLTNLGMVYERDVIVRICEKEFREKNTLFPYCKDPKTGGWYRELKLLSMRGALLTGGVVGSMPLQAFIDNKVDPTFFDVYSEGKALWGSTCCGTNSFLQSAETFGLWLSGLQWRDPRRNLISRPVKEFVDAMRAVGYNAPDLHISPLVDSSYSSLDYNSVLHRKGVPCCEYLKYRPFCTLFETLILTPIEVGMLFRFACPDCVQKRCGIFREPSALNTVVNGPKNLIIGFWRNELNGRNPFVEMRLLEQTDCQSELAKHVRLDLRCVTCRLLYTLTERVHRLCSCPSLCKICCCLQSTMPNCAKEIFVLYVQCVLGTLYNTNFADVNIAGIEEVLEQTGISGRLGAWLHEFSNRLDFQILWKFCMPMTAFIPRLIYCYDELYDVSPEGKGSCLYLVYWAFYVGLWPLTLILFLSYFRMVLQLIRHSI